MEKIKWEKHKDKNTGSEFIGASFKGDGLNLPNVVFMIYEKGNRFDLFERVNWSRPRKIRSFRKLSSAKKVAELFRNG